MTSTTAHPDKRSAAYTDIFGTNPTRRTHPTNHPTDYSNYSNQTQPANYLQPTQPNYQPPPPNWHHQQQPPPPPAYLPPPSQSFTRAYSQPPPLQHSYSPSYSPAERTQSLTGPTQSRAQSLVPHNPRHSFTTQASLRPVSSHSQQSLMRGRHQSFMNEFGITPYADNSMFHQSPAELEPGPSSGLTPISEVHYHDFDQQGPILDHYDRRPSTASDPHQNGYYAHQSSIPTTSHNIRGLTHSSNSSSSSNNTIPLDRQQQHHHPIPGPSHYTYGPPLPHHQQLRPNQTIQPRKSSESVRVMPTQPKPHTTNYDRSFSLTSQRTLPTNQTIQVPKIISSNPSNKPPIVYPALLSKVAESFKSRTILSERTKDGLTYTDCFDGKTAVDKIAYIIKTTDRNLALLLGRALDSQKFFHDVTYDHRLRDSPNELYQFRARLGSSFNSIEDLRSINLNHQNDIEDDETEEQIEEDEMILPCGVFTLLTDCYSPTCTRDKLCYSIACPRRLEQQARLNLKIKPGLNRSISTESLNDLKEPGTLWIHSVPQDVVDSVNDTEKKRQEAINECIYTERDFVRDLEYLRDFWIKPLQTTSIIPESRRQDFVTQVFWNVLEVLTVNSRLSELLSKRQKSSHIINTISDIYLDLVPHFGPFVQYGSHQLYGKYEFEKEKSTNLAFGKFVDETERLPESRKLELNAYLTKPTTRLARYPLLLEVVLKYTPEDHQDKIELPKVIKMIRELLTKVNIESGKSENRFNLAQLDQQLVFRQGEAVDLRLRDDGRELIYKGQLKKRGGGGSDSAELQVYLFDHALLMVKQKHTNKTDHLKVYRKPIPLELLTITGVVTTTTDEQPITPKSSVPSRKSLMARTTGQTNKTSSNPSSVVNNLPQSSKAGYPMTINHLGRKGYSIVLWAPTLQSRQKWLEKIEARQIELRERSTVFEMISLNEGFFIGSNKVTCAAPFDHGNRLVFGTDSGIYLSTITNTTNSNPIRVIQAINVTQVEVIEEHGILLVLADKAVMTFWIESLDPSDSLGAAKRARKISSNASFFKVGDCLGRKLVCIVKSGSVSSTIKTLEPSDNHLNFRGGKSKPLRKIIPGSNDALKVYKEFYIPTESSSVHFLKSKLCVGCNKGFEIVDLETLDTQGLLDPADNSLDFVQKKESVKPIAIYRVEGEFLLCYEDFAFYVNKNGWRARNNWIVQWEGHPVAFALHYPYVLAFEPSFVEVRHVESGSLMQIIPGPNIRHLFSDSTKPQQIVFAAESRILRLRLHHTYDPVYQQWQQHQQQQQQHYGQTR